MDKESIRRMVMDTMRREKVTRFPFLPARRIPNFKDALKAAHLLFELDEIQTATLIKCNPDSAQAPFREEALKRGIDLLIATPRLTDGFMYFNAAEVGENARLAAKKSHFEQFSTRMSLREIPQPDAVVVGSVAVGSGGERCGKGHGYADLECGILSSLGLRPCPVFSTVHDCQLVEAIPVATNDLCLSGFATPSRLVRTRDDIPPWPALDWDLLTPASFREMPLLEDLRLELS